MLALATLPMIACGGGEGDDDGGDKPIVPEGTYNHYTTDTIKLPANPTENRELAFNLDGDKNNRPDNALGGVIVALKMQANIDVQATVTESVTSGGLVLLHSLQAKDLAESTNVGWKVLLGAATSTPPKFDGTDMFQVAADSPNDGLLTGRITGGQFEGGPGNVTIALALTSGPPIQVKLIGARVRAKVTADGCTDGVLGGAITETELNESVIPGVRTLMNASIKEDAPDGVTLATCAAAGDTCPNSMDGETTACDVERKICVTNSTKMILNIFDADKSGEVSLDEIKNNTIIKALLGPDVDMLDPDGNYNPLSNPDKVDTDSLSVGIGFTCKKSVFTVAGE